MPVDDGNGIVIFDDVQRSAWIPGTDGQGGYLVVWNYCAAGTGDQVIAGKITTIPDELFNPTNLTVSFRDDTIYLFPACDMDRIGDTNIPRLASSPGYTRLIL